MDSVAEHIDYPHFPGTLQTGCPGCEAFWVELEPNDENDDWAMAHAAFSEDTYDPD